MWIVIVGAIAFIIWLISAIIKNYSSENQALTAKCKKLEKLNELNEKNITELKKDFEKLSIYEKVIPVFVCHNELSEVAKTFAKK